MEGLVPKKVAFKRLCVVVLISILFLSVLGPIISQNSQSNGVSEVESSEGGFNPLATAPSVPENHEPLQFYKGPELLGGGVPERRQRLHRLRERQRNLQAQPLGRRENLTQKFEVPNLESLGHRFE